MIFLTIGLILLIPGLINLYIVSGQDWNTRWSVRQCWAFWPTVFGTAAIFFGALIPTAVAYVGQIGDEASIQQARSNEVIYKTKADALTKQLSGYLAVQYPNFEKKVFSEIAGSPSLLFTVFPQLQSSQTLLALTRQISSLQDQVYAQQTAITQYEKNIAVRRRNPFFIPFLLP